MESQDNSHGPDFHQHGLAHNHVQKPYTPGAIGESISLVDSQPVKRLRDRAVVLLDQHTNPDGRRELQCVISNDSISSSPDCRCHGVFRQLLGQFESMPDVVVEAAAA